MHTGSRYMKCWNSCCWAGVVIIAFTSQPACRAAEVRREFTFQARRTVSFFLVLLAVCHAFGCLLWIVLRAQHFPEGKSTA